MSDKTFTNKLLSEMKGWVEDGLIDSSQEQRIKSRYTKSGIKSESGKPSAVRKEKAINAIRDIIPGIKPAIARKEQTINAAKIVIILASILLAAGIILFYASNWRKMPPVIKLAQIFILIFSVYGSAFFFLDEKRKMPILGSALLVLGIVSYGVGIMLIAQIYHINAHPADGVLAWAVGALIVSAAVKDRWGYAVSLALFFIWNLMELSAGSACYAFIVPVLIIGFIFYKMRSKAGFACTAALFCFYLYQVLLYLANKYGLEYWPEADLFFLIMLWGSAPLLVNAGRLFRYNTITSLGGNIMNAVGWASAVIPFLFLSWPFDTHNNSPLTFFRSSEALIAAHFIPLAVSLIPLRVLRKKGEPVILAAGLSFFSCVIFFVPLESVMTRMILLHIMIIAFAAALLYFPCGDERFKTEKFTGISFIVIVIIVKTIGFILCSTVVDYNFHVAYLAGAALFIIVCFLLNRIMEHLLQGKAYRAKLIDALCAVALWFTVYAASFKIHAQTSITQASRVAIATAIVFLVIALIFYVLLLTVLKTKKLMICLSFAILSGFVIMTLIAGPKIPWELYSVVFNLMLLGITSAYIYYGITVQSTILVNIATAGFVLHIITRYFDLFWDMLSGSLLFIVTGFIGLFGGYLLEKKRKNLIAQIEGKVKR